MQTNLQDIHVIVTGASGGIGRTIARSFADEGARVTVHFHQNREAANQIVSDIGSSHSQAVQADLTIEQEVAQLFEQAAQSWGPCRGFIANAGVWPSANQTIDQIPLERWNHTIAANLTSGFLCMKHFLKQAKQNEIEDPAAVLIGSTAGIYGEAGHADYAAAKAALIYGLLASLKNEFCRVVPRGRINAVCPGWTLTPMTEKFNQDPAAMKRALQTMSLRKFAKPEDIAAAVLFLTSASAGHMTGQVLTVAGGMEGRVLYSPDEIDI